MPQVEQVSIRLFWRLWLAFRDEQETQEEDPA